MTKYSRIKNFSPFCQFDQTSTKSQSSLFGHFDQSFGHTIVPKVRTINFFHNIVSQKNFRPKIQIWKKTDCSATYGHTRIKKILYVGNLEMFEGIKNMMVFCGHFFSRASCKVKPVVCQYIEEKLFKIHYSHDSI